MTHFNNSIQNILQNIIPSIIISNLLDSHIIDLHKSIIKKRYIVGMAMALLLAKSLTDMPYSWHALF